MAVLVTRLTATDPGVITRKEAAIDHLARRARLAGAVAGGGTSGDSIDAGRRAALERGRLDRIGRTLAGDAVAALRGVARTGSFTTRRPGAQRGVAALTTARVAGAHLTGTPGAVDRRVDADPGLTGVDRAELTV